VMVMMMMLARRRSVMGDFVLTPVLHIGGWLATAVMAAAAIAMIATSTG
jgi:Mn2+/Fe2+ NRAMP family transporter